MHYGNIKFNDIANGEGVRTSLFVSGCRIHCKGCFNAETWRFDYGKPFTEAEADRIIESLMPAHIAGLTVLGGEPMEPENQEVLEGLLQRVKATYPNKTIWLFTGYLHDQDLIPGGKRFTAYTEAIMASIDVIVDGPFIRELKDLSLRFRGSSNQRITYL